ncbi:hypothetical protein NDU88_002157 [Pleurodeles waltl]|uniref:Uncharacterized protein n=1 Tax=Pleurodeles waltl TaxID=8319 RepID=A0AAV7Q926_PLEWA|nr:hypothetical protein NDU88_002157 [Pleurodeles waltl]
MEMELCNFDILGRAELLKLYMQRGIKSETKATKLDVLSGGAEVEATSEEEFDDSDEEEGAQTGDDEVELPGKTNLDPVDPQDA